MLMFWVLQQNLDIVGPAGLEIAQTLNGLTKILPPEGLQQDLQQDLRHDFGQFLLRDLHKWTHAKLACINIAE